MWEYQNLKIFLQNFTNQIGDKKFLHFKKSKILYHGHMQWKTVTVKILLEIFMEKDYKNKWKRIYRVEKIGDYKNVKWKGYDNFFNSWLYKKGVIM